MKKTPYFGRAWTISVQSATSGQTMTISRQDWEPEALRCTFLVEQGTIASYWFAEITIWNYKVAMSQTIQKGDLVTLTAGYQSPAPGVLFKGKVFQPLWERANETDDSLTLNCFIGLLEDDTAFVNVAVENVPNTDVDAIVAITNAANLDIESLGDARTLQASTFPRRRTFAGRASSLLAEIATSNNLNFWIGWNGVNIRSLAPQTTTPDVIYAPPFSPGSQTASVEGLTKCILIGSPQQTEKGVWFRTLLDSEVKLGDLVKLDMSVIKQIALYPGNKPIILDQDGIYVVVGIHYVGDTRGNDWYSEISAVTREYSKLQAIYSR